ncbi:MAG: MoxR family ATPase [Spirochaetes bacterium]|nr:MoxR family ATPase [Spirochaetota bacterium]
MDKNDIRKISDWYNNIYNNIKKVFFGKEDVFKKIAAAILSNGHVLIEDVPGVGKTILAKAIAQSIGGTFSRIQCTPDLLPADIIGVSIYNPKDFNFTFHKGPVFSNIILVDEINRATPRTQSALLEAMGEAQVSVEGKMIELPKPFIIMATENPIDFEGTFPLPEAQKDRFFLSCKVGYPERNYEKEIFESQRRISHPVTDLKAVSDRETIIELQKTVVNVHVHKSITEYILDIVEKTRGSKFISLGISPRGALALYRGSQSLACLSGRDYVIPEDIKELVIPVFSKRMILTSDCLIKGMKEEEVLSDIMNSLNAPALKEYY